MNKDFSTQMVIDPLKGFIGDELTLGKHPDADILYPIFSRIMKGESLEAYIELVDRYKLVIYLDSTNPAAEYGAGLALLHRAYFRHHFDATAYMWVCTAISYLEKAAAHYFNPTVWNTLRNAGALTIAILKTSDYMRPEFRETQEGYRFEKACIVQRMIWAMFGHNRESKAVEAEEEVSLLVEDFIDQVDRDSSPALENFAWPQAMPCPQKLDSVAFCQWLANQAILNHLNANLSGAQGPFDGFRLLARGHAQTALFLFRGLLMQYRSGPIGAWARHGCALAGIQKIIGEPTYGDREFLIENTSLHAQKAMDVMATPDNLITLILSTLVDLRINTDTTERFYLAKKGLRNLHLLKIAPNPPAYADPAILFLLAEEFKNAN